MEIVRVNENDIDHLQLVSCRTFVETFAAFNSAENMKKYLDEAYSRSKLEMEIKDPNARFYFAREGEEILGYLKINTGASQTELKEAKTLEIERIYVHSAWQGKQVGKWLFDKAIDVAKELNAEYVWLGVWEHNTRAIGFYERQGFVAFDKHIFRLGDDEQTDILMKRPVAI